MLHSPLFFSTITNISRILRIVDKFIPIYKDIKPIAKNVPDIFNKLSTISKKVHENGNYLVNQTISKSENKNNNQPIFFK